MPGTQRTLNVPAYFFRKKGGGDNNQDDSPKIKDLLDKSSEVNRNLGLFMVGFLFYLLVTTTGITDLQLVMQDKGISLPIITITLPLLAFAWVTPVIVLGVHLNLLLNLLEHAVKLDAWLETERAKPGTDNQQHLIQKQLHPFLFNYTLAKKGGFFLFITKLLVNCSAFFLPMITLFYIEYRFADLHDRGLTGYQFWVFLADALLVAFFYPAMFLPRLDTFSIKQLCKRFVDYGLLPVKMVINIVLLVSKRNRSSIKSISFTRIIDQCIFGFLVLVAFLYLFIIYLITDANRYKILVAYECGDSWQKISKLYRDNEYCAAYHSDFIPNFSEVKRKLIPIPAILLHGEKLVLSTPSLQEVLLAKQNHLSQDSFIINYTKGINLQDRDFTLADIENCELIKVNMSHVNMLGANISNCNLSNGDLSEIQLKEVCMAHSVLLNAELTKANLQKAILMGIDSRGAFLKDAKLLGAILDDVDFRGADMSFTDLRETDLTGAKLQGADLAGAELQGVDLTGAQLQGADLSKAELQGAKLSLAGLQGACLIRSFIKGIDLPPNEVLTHGIIACCCDTLTFSMDINTNQRGDLLENYGRHSDYEKNMLQAQSRKIVTLPASDWKAFTEEREQLLVTKEIPLDNILLSKYALDETEIDKNNIIHHNKAIVQYCMENHYSWRLEEIKQLDENEYPGIK